MSSLLFLFLLGRLLFGGFFILMGINHLMKKEMLVGYAKSKGVAAPEAAVVVSGLMILLGGLGVLLGVWVEWALSLVIVFLLGVSFKMHAFWTVQDPQAKMMDMVQFQKNLALMGAALMMLSLVTPWAYVVAL